MIRFFFLFSKGKALSFGRIQKEEKEDASKKRRRKERKDRAARKILVGGLRQKSGTPNPGLRIAAVCLRLLHSVISALGALGTRQ